MNLFIIHQLFQDIQYCKTRYALNEKEEFIVALQQLLRSNLPAFGSYMDEYNISLSQEYPSHLSINAYENVEEIFQVVRQILYDAAYSDTHLSYKLMQFKLACLFAPLAQSASNR